MQELKSQMILKLRNILKNKIKGNIVDIFIIGSSLKNKLVPGDLDIIVLFREKKVDVGDLLYEIKEGSNFIKELHIESIFVESFFSEKIFLTILHEGFSIKENKFVSELLGLNSLSIFTYDLKNLPKVGKVRFAQALYGRKKDGLLFSEKGTSLGNGSFMIPVKREEIFKEFLKKWKVSFKYKRAFVSN